MEATEENKGLYCARCANRGGITELTRHSMHGIHKVTPNDDDLVLSQVHSLTALPDTSSTLGILRTGSAFRCRWHLASSDTASSPSSCTPTRNPRERATCTGHGSRTMWAKTMSRLSRRDPVRGPLNLQNSVEMWLLTVEAELLERHAVLQSPARIEQLVKVFIHATKVSRDTKCW